MKHADQLRIIRSTSARAPAALDLATAINAAIPPGTDLFDVQLALAILAANAHADQAADREEAKRHAEAFAFMATLQTLAVYGRKHEAKAVPTPAANAVRTH